MKTIYPAVIAVSLLLSLWAVFLGSSFLADDWVEISRENVYSHYDFTREVLAGCPIEQARLHVDTNVVTISYPREEYRDLRQRLEHQGWEEQGSESGRYSLGQMVVLVEHGELTILPQSLARR